MLYFYRKSRIKEFSDMRLLSYIVWFIFVGLLSSVVCLAVGVLLCCTVILIPFGLQCFKLARLVVTPFGKKVDSDFFSHPIANTLWLVFIGWEIAFFQLIVGLLFCLTIVGIPFGIQLFKIAKLTLVPFGAKIA